MPLRIAAIDGGDRGNAIPRDAAAIVLLRRSDAERFTATVKDAAAAVAARHAHTDSTPRIAVTPAMPGTHAFPRSDTARLLDLLCALPDGVLEMSRKLPDLVESSCNVGVVQTRANTVHIVSNARSSDPESLDQIVQRIAAASRASGARARPGPGYPPWDPDPDSPLLQRAIAVYSRVHGEAPKVASVHAGLECGVIKAKLPWIQALSFGPDIRGAHSARERVRVSSVAKCYALLTALLADLASSPLRPAASSPSAPFLVNAASTRKPRASA
jgi:dipeptidase D